MHVTPKSLFQSLLSNAQHTSNSVHVKFSVYKSSSQPVKSSLPSSLNLGGKNKITFLIYSAECRNPEVKWFSYFLCSSQHKYCQVLGNSTSLWVSLLHLTLFITIVIIPAEVLNTAYLEKRKNPTSLTSLLSCLLQPNSPFLCLGFSPPHLCSKAFRRFSCPK